MLSLSRPCLGNCVIYFRWRIYSATAPELYLCSYWYIFSSCNGVCIDMIVHIIMFSLLLCVCILYNLTVDYTSSCYFVLYLSCAYSIPPLLHCYICFLINIVVNFIPVVTAICLCTLYNLLLGCAISWASCYAYFLYIIGYSIVVILVDLNSQKWIDTWLF